MLTDGEMALIKQALDRQSAERSKPLGTADWSGLNESLICWVIPLVETVNEMKAELYKLRHLLVDRDDRIKWAADVNANQRVTIGQRDKTIGGLQASYSSLWDTYTRVVANHDDLAVALKNERSALQAQREAFRLLAETYDDLVARLDEKATIGQAITGGGIKIPVRCGGGFASFHQEKKHGG